MFELTVFSFCQSHHVIDGRFTDTPDVMGSELAFPVLPHVMSTRVMDKGASRAKEKGTQTISSYKRFVSPVLSELKFLILLRQQTILHLVDFHPLFIDQFKAGYFTVVQWS